MEKEYDLILRAHRGEKAARDALVYENSGLVWSVVKRFAYKETDPEDLYQIGVIGLLKAIDRFDPAYQVCFSTYAVPVISGELRRFLRDDGPVKISRTLRENQKKIRQFRKTSKKENPGMQELAQATGLSVEDIVLAEGSALPVESIYQTVYESEGNSLQLIDQLADEGEAFDETTVNRQVLKEALHHLKPMERQLIYCRYFKNMTQNATAKELEMNQVQVSRMEKKILQKMRREFVK